MKEGRGPVPKKVEDRGCVGPDWARVPVRPLGSQHHVASMPLQHVLYVFFYVT